LNIQLTGTLVKVERSSKAQGNLQHVHSVLDTNSFGNIIFDVWKDKDEAKITDNLGQLNIGNEPASSFSCSQGDKEFMVVALMHNNIGYVFEYGTK
jgi:hypothetical protein